jgi:hypothetical protein
VAGAVRRERPGGDPLGALTSGLLMCLVLLLLFICMRAFTDSAPDAVRAATRSLLVAAAGVATNLSSRTDGERRR